MRVEINGEVKEVPARLKLDDLIRFLNLPHDRLAVEFNRRVIRRQDWPETDVSEGDRIEIVHFVGGGAAEKEHQG